jgi:predicted TIM-barrel fold metal-dependent hydrolase
MRKYIDVNCFIGGPGPGCVMGFAGSDELLEEMDDIGISSSFVSCFPSEKDPSGNRRLLEEAGKSPRLMPCPAVLPRVLGDKKVLRDLISEARRMKIRMMRACPSDFLRHSAENASAEELMEFMAGERIVLMADFGFGPGLTQKRIPPEEFDTFMQFASGAGSLRIILSGRKLAAAKPEVLKIIRTCENVMLDISSFQTWLAVEKICSEPGAGSLVFGSSMPYFNGGQFTAEVELAMVSEEEKDHIAYKNIEDIII